MDEKSVIQERLKLLSEYINDLLDLQNVDLETYTENKLARRAVERTLLGSLFREAGIDKR